MIPVNRPASAVAPFVTFVSAIDGHQTPHDDAQVQADDERYQDMVALFNAGPTTISLVVLCLLADVVHSCAEGAGRYRSVVEADHFATFPLSMRPESPEPQRVDVVLLMDHGQSSQIASVSSAISARTLGQGSAESSQSTPVPLQLASDETFGGCDLISFTEGRRDPTDPYTPIRSMSANTDRLELVLELCDTRRFSLHVVRNGRSEGFRLPLGISEQGFSVERSQKSYRTFVDLEEVEPGDVLQAFAVTDGASGRIGLFTLPVYVKDDA